MRYLYSSFRNGSFFAITGLYILLSSCSQKIYFEQSSTNPAARGEVKIKKDKNKNYSVDISTLHLAEPKRMQPPGHTYVVWMETGQGNAKNIGQIQSTTGFLSKALKGSL